MGDKSMSKQFAELMTVIVWGDTKGWIDPIFRGNTEQEAQNKSISDGLNRQMERDMQEIRNYLAKKRNV